MEYIDQATGEIKQPPFLRTPYNYDMNAASDESGLKCEDPTRTQQNFKDDADINVIVERFGLTGQLPENVNIPLTGDYVDTVNDYQSAMNIAIKAQEEFMKLPAKIRARFHNDPQELMTFVEDKANLEEARALGILKPAPTPAPTPAPEAPPAK